MGGLWDSEPDSSVVKGQDQGWEFAHLLIAHSLIRSFAHSLIRWFVDLLVLLKSNDRLLAIRSRQMSDRDRIAQVVQRKWATVRKSLRSHDKWSNEQFAIKILAKKI